MIHTTSGIREHVDTLVVGAGFGGVAVVDELLHRDRDADLLVIEREDSVGGTWRDNTYPGCACDVPTALYSLSRHPNPDWSHTFGRQPEILEYLRWAADRIGVTDRLVTGCELEHAGWDDDAGLWRVETSRGDVTARYLVVATGALSTPNTPRLEGLENFGGDVFHSAKWDHDVPLAGRRVAVVGTGASAIQFVPEIAPDAEQTTVFQRTPGWVLPRLDRGISAMRKRWYRRLPWLQKLDRARIYALREVHVVAFTHGRRVLLPLVEIFARLFLFAQVRDRRLRRHLTPDFSIGCKRVLLTNDWFPALSRDDVTLLPSAAAGVNPGGVVDAHGTEHPADVLIFGTGFQPTAPPVAKRLTGADGRTMSEVWDGSPHAYLGVSVPGFANLALVYGPNTNLGHSSIVYMIERQAGLVAELIEASRGAGTPFEARSDVERRYNEQLDELLSDTVWNDGGCASWYLDEHGRNSLQWPTFTWRYRRAVDRADPADFAVG